MYKRNRAVLGENRTQAKLTNKQANDIRQLYRDKKGTLRSLGSRFGVSSAVIFNIIHNRTYYIWP